jgi:hypothetical protein
MKRIISRFSRLAVLSLLGVACDNGTPAAPPTPIEQPDAGPIPPEPTAPIPLLTWVHALVTDDPEGLRAPDTVHDKNIEDTSNPEAFAEFLPTP